MESMLVHLKAELHKKRTDVKRFSTDASIQNHKLKPLGRETKGQNNDRKYPSSTNKTEESSNDKTEEILKLEKSKKMLEEKAALYDKIKGGIRVLEDDDLNQKYLVDFQEKIQREVNDAKAVRERAAKKDGVNESNSYKAKDETEEWVEYIDSFGRTRVCHRQDLADLQEQGVVKKTVLNSDSRKQQEKWEAIAQETQGKDKVHYQDVLFDEARSHGAGFMAFSRDEGERLKQQEALRELGAEAARAREVKEAAQKKQKKALEGRLAKVRQRKRLKRGLPCKDLGELKTPPGSDNEEEANATTNLDDGTNRHDGPNRDDVIGTVPPTESNEIHVREWDLGKPGVRPIMTQEQWIETRRKLRENEFAPPTAYQDSHSTKTTTKKARSMYQRHFRPLGPSQTGDSHPQFQEGDRLGEFAPPAAYQETSCTKNTANIARSTPQKHVRPPGPPQTVDEHSEFQDDDRRGEFAPPSSFDYYNSERPGKASRSLGNKINVAAAISKGLSQLRNEYSGAN